MIEYGKPSIFGFKRNELPQIKPEVFSEFLNTFNIEIKIERRDPKNLLPIQCEFNEEKIIVMMERLKTEEDKFQGTIITSRDGYVIDGHHRWLASLNLDIPVNCVIMDVDVHTAIKHLFDFGKVTKETI